MAYPSFSSEDVYKAQFEKMIQLTEEFLPLRNWGFKQSVRFVEKNPKIIYDSEWCRVKIAWSGWDVYVGDMISIHYGRLHAPNDKIVITWNGEEGYCWHRINEPLLFLDGLPPTEAVDHSTYGQQPDVMAKFGQSDLGKSLAHKQPEGLIRMHTAIWEHYGQRLFELFDLRHPDLWEQYTDFIQMYYEVKGLIPDMTPPQGKIC